MEIIKYGPRFHNKEYEKMDFETTCPHCVSIFRFNKNEMNSRLLDNILEYYVQCPVCDQFLYQNTLNIKFNKL